MRAAPTAIAAVLAAALSLPLPAAAGLGDEREVTERLIVVGMADQLRKTCGEVDARMVRAYAYLRDIARIALDLGYDRATIEAYIEDREVKDGLRAVAARRLEARGVRAGDVAAHCRAAREEIARGTAVGWLLRD